MSGRVRVDIALVHYPVYNKKGEVVASAVTNLDLHDIARLAKTYGLGAFHVITPVKEQQAFIRRILDHWLLGWGNKYNKDRTEALKLIRIKDSIELAKQSIYVDTGKRPLLLITGAKEKRPMIGLEEARKLLKGDRPVLLVFGTAWGLEGQVIEQADYMLPPVQRDAEYNHLSVRTAAAIIVDRFLGDRV